MADALPQLAAELRALAAPLPPGPTNEGAARAFCLWAADLLEQAGPDAALRAYRADAGSGPIVCLTLAPRGSEPRAAVLHVEARHG